MKIKKIYKTKSKNNGLELDEQTNQKEYKSSPINK
jgi:hypothetical protein